ncbi:MAG: arsenite methyltransferase [Thermoproteota archaeon]|nr:arsenite methyltransferase [Thermoproteota archaeon]
MTKRIKNIPSCCSPDLGTQQAVADSKKEIRKRYGELAKNSATYAIPDKDAVTKQAEYSQEELELLPNKAAAASAGCGNPTALARLKKGEVVLDLGSGGGIDVFLAAEKIGPKGLVIGVDMTPEMIDLARENTVKAGAGNVEFRLGEIEHLPVADMSVDVIISNCVINLSTQKEQVFKEAYRVLKKGGRLLVSDMMVKGIPDESRRNMTMWSSCIAEAVELEEYIRMIREAGFTEIEVVKNKEYSTETINSWIESIEEDMDKKEKEELRRLEHAVEGKIKVSHADVRATKK